MERRWLIVLPSLFTVSSIFCGIFAIIVASGAPAGSAPQAYYRAAMAILLGALLDGFDGRVARLTGTQSEFGVQLDSLADVITFGAAPAVLLYQWALHPLGMWGVGASAIFAACGAIRLARFNVLAGKSSGPSDFFVGLPIPLAAGMVVAVVVAMTGASEPKVVPPVPVAVLSLVLSYLMVSTIPYRSFKKVKPGPALFAALGTVIAAAIAISVWLRPSLVFVAISSTYVLAGLGEEIVFRRRRAEELALATGAGHLTPSEGADDDAGQS